MHPLVSEALDYFDAQRAVLRRVASAVPAELVGRRPAPDQWSVAQILAHLAMSATGAARLLRTHVESAAPELGPETATGSVIATVDVARLLDRSRRTTAGAELEPREDADAERAWRGLERARDELRALLLEYDGVALSKVRVPNKVLGPLDVYQWIVFLAGHEARHAAQIEETVATLTAEPAGA